MRFRISKINRNLFHEIIEQSRSFVYREYLTIEATSDSISRNCVHLLVEGAVFFHGALREGLSMLCQELVDVSGVLYVQDRWLWMFQELWMSLGFGLSELWIFQGLWMFSVGSVVDVSENMDILGVWASFSRMFQKLWIFALKHKTQLGSSSCEN